jgi:hypothetical protein
VPIVVGVIDLCGNRVVSVRWVCGVCSSTLLGGLNCDL